MGLFLYLWDLVLNSTTPDNRKEAIQFSLEYNHIFKYKCEGTGTLWGGKVIWTIAKYLKQQNTSSLLDSVIFVADSVFEYSCSFSI